jgi:L-ascorbate metabolism protein UlaG (beta-lactamase superfamily)
VTPSSSGPEPTERGRDTAEPAPAAVNPEPDSPGAASPPSPVGDRTTVVVRFVGHATTVIEIGGLRVLTDPFLGDRLGPLVRHGRRPRMDDLEVDAVVISHGHPDHFDRRSLAALPGRPLVAVPRGLGEVLRRERLVRGEVAELEAGGSIRIGGLAIRAVPARHWISPGSPRARPIGYVLEAGARVYFAGDTGRFDDLSQHAGAVDVALLPVWTWGPHLGPGHLGPRTASEVLRELRPAAAVPIHWGTLYPRHLHHVLRGPLADPGGRFAEHASRVAPDVDVRVLRPGEETAIGVS